MISFIPNIPQKLSLVFLLVTIISFSVLAKANTPDLDTRQTVQCSENGRIDLWPVIYGQNFPEEQGRVREWLWPFIFFQADKEGTVWGLRPVFNIKQTGANDSVTEKQLQILWPIFEHRLSAGGERTYLLPLYYYRNWEDQALERPDPSDSDSEQSAEKHLRDRLLIVFPIILGGTKDGQNYLTIFPLGGNLKGWFGTDEVKFVLWPIYTQARKGEQKSLVILWPFYSRTHSPQVSSWRLWPIAGHGYKKGEYEKVFFLWPVFNFQRLDMGIDEPGQVVMILPLYARMKKKDFQATSILWPFFGHSRNSRGNWQQWNLPWPIIAIKQGENIHTRRFWPLIGWQKRKKDSSAFFLWPIFFANDYKDEKRIERRRTILPFYFSRHRFLKDKDKQESEHALRLWPLFSYRRTQPGASKFYMISPLWFEENEGIQTNYAPFWHLWDYERDGQGNIQASLIGRLFSYQREGQQKKVELIHLVAYNRSEQDKKFSILKGMFEYRKTDKVKTLKILYLLKIKIR